MYKCTTLPDPNDMTPTAIDQERKQIFGRILKGTDTPEDTIRL